MRIIIVIHIREEDTKEKEEIDEKKKNHARHTLNQQQVEILNLHDDHSPHHLIVIVS